MEWRGTVSSSQFDDGLPDEAARRLYDNWMKEMRKKGEDLARQIDEDIFCVLNASGAPVYEENIRRAAALMGFRHPSHQTFALNALSRQRPTLN